MLIKGNQPNLDLSKQYGVTDVWCAITKDITIHLSCKEGDEQKVIDNLPKWVFEEMRVVKSHTHVFIKAKLG
jgi:hypothetical protein